MIACSGSLTPSDSRRATVTAPGFSTEVERRMASAVTTVAATACTSEASTRKTQLPVTSDSIAPSTTATAKVISTSSWFSRSLPATVGRPRRPSSASRASAAPTSLPSASLSSAWTMPTT